MKIRKIVGFIILETRGTKEESGWSLKKDKIIFIFAHILNSTYKRTNEVVNFVK